ncbi:MAG TPA: hypothetical protein VIJ52_06565 [Pseudolabrys sp.]
MTRQAMIGLALVALVSAPGLAAAESYDGAYRGMIVCEKLQTSQFMLRAPFDIIITGNTVVAARPIFNRAGTLVVGSEIATGMVGDDGAIKLASTWIGNGSTSQGNYSGTLNGKTGTLTGTQAWTMPEGQQTRSCTAAVVQTKS